MQARGLKGVEMIVADNHTGLKAACENTMPSIPMQRCTFHIARNAQSYCTKMEYKKEIGRDVADVFKQINYSNAMRRKNEVCEKWSKKAPDFSRWFDEVAEEGMTFYMFKDPSVHSRLRTVNILERTNSEIRRRTRVARLFPNEASCLRLVSAVLMEIHENWITNKVYINQQKLEVERNYRKYVA